jgi:4-alpha-glucanotransferase
MRWSGGVNGGIGALLSLLAILGGSGGFGAIDGAYVIYPLPDILAQVALASHRAQCLVVGEDRGTVPEGMSDALSAANILSYSVLWFEGRDGRIRPPPEWCRLAAACVSTHDLATLAGWWNGADTAEKRVLSLLNDPDAAQARADEKAALVALLQAEALLTEDVDPQQPMPPVFAP